ncbi:hypothetical protein BRADI_3g12480v3 [Brachypodium distachyon]|uniref:C2H2-type domain-containing protein n=1 Tax=Brachypodium distachyon TaxID=15368 RepID=A0A2K2CWR1_BRADI|nr:hypothetical protein BRADI_3g12480v3 [Brachypodium distachyon]
MSPVMDNYEQLDVELEKVQLLHPLVGLVVHSRGDVDPVVVADAGAIVQEIVASSSSMMYAFQHLCGAAGAATTSAPMQLCRCRTAGCSDHQLQAMEDHEADMMQQQHSGFYDDDGTFGKPPAVAVAVAQQEAATDVVQQEAASPGSGTSTTATTIIELDAAELLAKYTDYCQVCGKGFKREANSRAHGDQYKSKAALASPLSMPSSSPASNSSKFSCPQEGCRRNMRHVRFTPLSSVICAKNHYKRSHCPKMYVCNRCGRKHFSVLSDLRTHEKHCGHSRWLCSCGTTFSRKDKLAGHVSTFAGHHSVAAAARDQRTIY